MSALKKELNTSSKTPRKFQSDTNWSNIPLFLQQIGNERFNKMDLIRAFMLGFVLTILLTNTTQYLGVNISARLVEKSVIETVEVTPIVISQPKTDADVRFLNVINPIKGISLDKEIIASKKETNQKTSVVKKGTLAEVIGKEVVPTAKVTETEKLEKRKDKKEVKVSKPSLKRKIVKEGIRKPIKKNKSTPIVETKSANSWNTVQAEAIADGKASFIIFGASWCAPCKIMLKSVRENQNLQAYIQSNQVYRYIDINSGEGRYLNLEYQIKTLPSIVFFDKNGKVIRTEEGTMSSHDLLNMLKGKETASNTNQKVDSIKKVEKTAVLDSNQAIIIDELIFNMIEHRAEKE